jgi:hypothetical protein
MNKLLRAGKPLSVLLVLIFFANVCSAQKPFKVLAFYTTTVERDHVDFANDAIHFFDSIAAKENFVFDTTTAWENTNDAILAKYDVVMWINEFPHTEDQRRAFERYMDNGGAWMGFHVSGYNDKDTHWPWFVTFMGGAVFRSNNWPPMPAKLIVDDTTHPVTIGMPGKYTAPPSEWYGWNPSPRLNSDVKVLVTFDPVNHPYGKKNFIQTGDIPIVWTNTKYHMLYLNMGHGDQVLTDPVYQNKMIVNALFWLAKRK